jgi:hypothetical protein
MSSAARPRQWPWWSCRKAARILRSERVQRPDAVPVAVFFGVLLDLLPAYVRLVVDAAARAVAAQASVRAGGRGRARHVWPGWATLRGGGRSFPCDAHLWLTFLINSAARRFTVFARLTHAGLLFGALLALPAERGRARGRAAGPRRVPARAQQPLVLGQSRDALLSVYLRRVGDVEELLRQSPRSATDSAGLGKGAGLGGTRPEIARDKRERARAAELEAKGGAAGVAAAEAAARREVSSLEARREERRKTRRPWWRSTCSPSRGTASRSRTAVTLLVINPGQGQAARVNLRQGLRGLRGERARLDAARACRPLWPASSRCSGSCAASRTRSGCCTRSSSRAPAACSSWPAPCSP